MLPLMPRPLPLLILGLALGSTACAAIDPYEREGVWTPTGSSEANLRAMVANPDDLVRGEGESGEVGKPAADAVAAWRADHVKPLPASSDLYGGSQGQGGGNMGGAGGGMPGGGMPGGGMPGGGAAGGSLGGDTGAGGGGAPAGTGY